MFLWMQLAEMQDLAVLSLFSVGDGATIARFAEILKATVAMVLWRESCPIGITYEAV